MRSVKRINASIIKEATKIRELRLFTQNQVEPDLGWALDETIMLHVKSGDAPSSVHFWRSPPSIVLGNLRLKQDQMNFLNGKNIKIIRRVTDGPTFYTDEGSLLFGFILDTNDPFFPKELNDLYRLIYSPIIETIENCGLNCTFDKMSYLFVGDVVISQVSQFWYYDVLVFQGVIYLDSDVEFVNSAGILSKKISSLTRLSSKKKSINEFIEEALQRIREKFEATLVEGSLTDLEKKTLDRVLKTKYQSPKWNLEFSPPLAYGKLLIEILTASPPTKTCLQIEKNMKEAIRKSEEEEKIELRVWRRGKGLPPGASITDGLIEAAKRSQIPAVIINGELKYGRTVLSPEEFLSSIREEIVRIK
ncbi:MAG: lipoyl protein ligase domain-containing protein [Candidatus Jordarchaeum sp.]|uniref:lipoyl protein ligase domain-containing protein n=1 Tax=Candidatus Jordarchaeum sp. TaxID=2823881 RepID=UPI00404A597E